MNFPSPPEWSLHSLSRSLGWTLVHSLWQGAAIAAGLAVVLGLLHGRTAAARHAACLAALLALVVAASVTWRRVERRVELVRPSVRAAASRVAGVASDTPAGQDERWTDQGPVVASKAASGVRPPPMIVSAEPRFAPLTHSWRTRLEAVLPWLSICWGVGVLALSIRHAAGWWRISRWRRAARPARADLQTMVTELCARYGLRAGAVRLRETAEAGIPMLTGFFRPILLLPVRAITGLNPQELEAVLAHELAHLVRRDTWLNPALLAVETLFFYHPAVWWIARRARAERELAADDLTLRVCRDRRVYAGALARLADFQQPPSDLVLAATGGRGTLLFRVRRILQPARDPAPPTPSAWGLALMPTALALTLGLVWMTRVRAADDPKTVNVAPGQSVQAAIDAAAPGTVIRLAAGEWQENVVVTKPLTLEGAGWEQTRLVAGETAPPSRTENLDFQVRSKAARTAEEKRELATEQIRNYDQPVLWVHDTREVTLRGVRVQGRSPAGGRDGKTLAIFQRGGARVEACAFVGPAGNGLSIGRGADVEVKDCLVAAVTNDGIGVSGRDEETPGEPGRLHLVDSEVRNAYYAGIVLGHGCDSTVIERSRISGSAWHGIRYDDASPTITGCTIFAHARCGIYASGQTQATIRGNLFYKNEMDGIWALEGNADRIEGNTFVDNLREGMGVSGAKPTVARNLFVGSPVAIVCSSVSSRNGPPSAPGDPTLRANVFWNNKTVLQKGGENEPQPVPPGSVEADPRFRDASKLDFALAADSAVRGSGAPEPLPPGGPWPLLAEERAIIPSGDTRDSRSWKFNVPHRNPLVVAMPTPRPASGAQRPPAPSPTPPVAAATPTARPERTEGPGALVAALLPPGDPAKQAAAADRLRGELESGDLPRVRLALAALAVAMDFRAKFDQTAFRPALRLLVGSPEADVRRNALLALGNAGPNAGDLELALARVDDPAPEVREMVPAALTMLSDENLTGKVSDALLRLLDRDDPGMARNIWGQMWTAKLSPELEKRVVAASYHDGGTTGYSDVFYYALIRHFTKREPTVSRLIELSTSPDQGNVGYFCYWGLLRGVDISQQARVCDFALKTLNDPKSERFWGMSLGLLATYGTSGQSAPLREWVAAKPWIKGDLRKAAEDALAKAEARPVVNAENAVSTEQQQAEDARVRRLLEINQTAARQRAGQDRTLYDEAQLREIENLYQVANQKGLHNEQSRASLRELLGKYDKANRTGCATLYYGQGSEGAERLEYLTRAVEKFSDCYYFNGCQVGGYGRYLLALTLWDTGEKDRARALVAELRTTYREATDHQGRPMPVLADEAEKFFAQKP